MDSRERIYSALGWSETPRAIGSPFQRIIHTREEYEDFIDRSNGRTICFTSHNSYPAIGDFGNPLSVNSTKVFFDFDSVDKPENALLDVRKLIRWSRENNLPTAVAFSGKKGFHVYILLKPVKIELNATYSSYLRGFQNYVIDELGLRTADPRVVGDTKRLCRIWYTKWATIDRKTQEPIVGEMYCCPISEEYALTTDIDDIMDYARLPNRKMDEDLWVDGRSWLTFPELIRKFNVQPGGYEDGKPSYLKENELKQYTPPENDYIKALFPKMCVHSELIGENPAHLARFAAVVQLKELGNSPGQIFDLLMALGWIDRRNGGMMRYQINQIYNRQPVYKSPSCTAIKKAGFCVGKVCPIYWED